MTGGLPNADLGSPRSPNSVGCSVSGWEECPPVLVGRRVRLRELRPTDAASLLSMLTSQEMTRFISPPPATVEGFERFIDWSIRQRTRGAHVAYAITLVGQDSAIGLFQVRRLNRDFEIAEWGFALASSFWGSGVFEEGARLILDFVFGTIGVHRLEARAAVRNGRGTGALLKMGAVQEGLLRKALLRNGQFMDQVLYSILKEDWYVRSDGARAADLIQVH